MSPSETTQRPNIIVILTDDQDYPSLAVMRKLMGYAGEGSAMPGWATFTDYGVTTSLCAPSRASLLTGQYAYQHGVTINTEQHALDTSNTLATWLKGAGYLTALYGKWLVGADKVKPSPPGWDVFEQGGRSDKLAKSAATYIQSVASADKPFFLVVSTGDPHAPYSVPSRYRNEEIDLPSLPAADNDLSDKPAWVQKEYGYGESRKRLQAYRLVLAVDDMVESIVNTLTTVGRLNDTVIIFASDNGFCWGNGVRGKNTQYEPAVHVPMLIYDPATGMNCTCDRVVSNVDLTATIVDYAGATAGLPLEGRSLVPLIRATGPEQPEWEDVMLIEGHPANGDSRSHWVGLRTRDYVYVEHSTSERELYHRSSDPNQNHNLLGATEHAEAQANLAERLTAIVGGVPDVIWQNG